MRLTLLLAAVAALVDPAAATAAHGGPEAAAALAGRVLGPKTAKLFTFADVIDAAAECGGGPSCCAISYAPTATPTLAPTADAGDRRRLSGARCSPPSCSAELSILLKRTLVIAAATILGFTLLHLVCFALAGAAIVVEEEGFREKELRAKGGAHWH